MHPLLYVIRIKQKRLFRYVKNLKVKKKLAKTIQVSPLPYQCTKHQSLLRRKLGTSDPKLQENKIVNLTIASSKIDGIIIKPGEVFSFWELVGNTTKSKGYIEA